MNKVLGSHTLLKNDAGVYWNGLHSCQVYFKIRVFFVKPAPFVLGIRFVIFIRPLEVWSALCYGNGYLFLLNCATFFLVLFWVWQTPKIPQKNVCLSYFVVHSPGVAITRLAQWIFLCWFARQVFFSRIFDFWELFYVILYVLGMFPPRKILPPTFFCSYVVSVCSSLRSR